MGEVRIGTSGFSYEDWKGHFYNSNIKKGDMLEYYASCFDIVEINSTYYAISSPNVFDKLISKVPENFIFTVKSYKDITHSHELNDSVVISFVSSINPLIEANKLGCVLLQFPWNYKCVRDNVLRIKHIKDIMSGIPLVIEFRNSQWATEKAYDFLSKNNLGFCCVDEPSLDGLMPQLSVVTSSIAYVRFHGRNSSKWWNHKEAWERYDYKYNNNELSEWIPKVKQMNTIADKTFVFFNNHFQGKAADNADEFRKMMVLAEKK